MTPNIPTVIWQHRLQAIDWKIEGSKIKKTVHSVCTDIVVLIMVPSNSHSCHGMYICKMLFSVLRTWPAALTNFSSKYESKSVPFVARIFQSQCSQSLWFKDSREWRYQIIETILTRYKLMWKTFGKEAHIKIRKCLPSCTCGDSIVLDYDMYKNLLLKFVSRDSGSKVIYHVSETCLWIK